MGDAHLSCRWSKKKQNPGKQIWNRLKLFVSGARISPLWQARVVNCWGKFVEATEINCFHEPQTLTVSILFGTKHVNFQWPKDARITNSWPIQSNAFLTLFSNNPPKPFYFPQFQSQNRTQVYLLNATCWPAAGCFLYNLLTRYLFRISWPWTFAITFHMLHRSGCFGPRQARV